MQEIDDFLAYLLAGRAYSPRTVVTYREALEEFEAYKSQLDASLTWRTLHVDVVRGWMAQLMDEGCGARTVNKKLSALRSFYRYLLRMKRVEHNPLSLLRNPKAVKPLPVFLRESEMDRLFDDVMYPPNYEGARDRLILLTFYTTGIRLSELVGLDVTDVDLSQQELKVTGKRNKQRIVPFGRELCQAFREYIPLLRRTGGCDSALFLSLKGQRISPAQVQQVVKKYLSLVTSQKKRSPHVLRHTFATVMLNHGADLETIRELLGHESVTTTEVYTHTTFADLKKAYEQAHPRA